MLVTCQSINPVHRQSKIDQPGISPFKQTVSRPVMWPRPRTKSLEFASVLC